jgi:hypothetical protein
MGRLFHLKNIIQNSIARTRKGPRAVTMRGPKKNIAPRRLFRTEGKGGIRGTRTIGMAPQVNDKRGIVTLDCVYG